MSTEVSTQPYRTARKKNHRGGGDIIIYDRAECA